MTISILGINHRTAPVELRERVALGPVQLEQALTELKQLPGIEEAIIVSTCNRTELYCHGHAEHQPMLHWLSQFHGITPSELEQHHYYHIQEDVYESRNYVLQLVFAPFRWLSSTMDVQGLALLPCLTYP